MGAIRGVILAFVVSLFFLSVLSAGIIYNVSLSLNYDNLKTELVPVVDNLFLKNLNLGSMIDSGYVLMQTYCGSNSQYTFNYGNYTIIFPCSVIMQGKDAIINYGAEQVIKNFYYQEYNCKFFDCFNQDGLPLFLISNHTRVYLMAKFYFLLAVAVALSILMFLLVKKKSNMPIIVGIAIIIASFPTLKVNLLSAFIPGQLSSVANVFFSSSSYVFQRMIILGIIVLAIGIIFKVFGITEKISEFINRKKEERGQPVKRKGKSK
jgi:hypothetical protein